MTYKQRFSVDYLLILRCAECGVVLRGEQRDALPSAAAYPTTVHVLASDAAKLALLERALRAPLSLSVARAGMLLATEGRDARCPLCVTQVEATS